MSKKLELGTELNLRWKITLIAKEVLLFANYLSKPDTEQEQDFIVRHRHLSFINWSLWRLAVIELCKLYGESESQKFHLQKLLKKLSKEGYYRSMKFDQEKLQSWKERLLVLQPAVDEIFSLRNTLYAHTDADPFGKIQSNITFQQCKDLVDLAEEIIRSVSGQILDNDYIFRSLYFHSRPFDFVKILSEVEYKYYKDIAESNGMSYDELVNP